jgi:hypothetical protein
MTLRHVFRWRGSMGWLKDTWDQDDPIGYASKAEADARVQELLGYHRRRFRKEMYPPPIAWTEMPRWKPRPKEQRHRYAPAELNGHSYRREAVPEQEMRR